MDGSDLKQQRRIYLTNDERRGSLFDRAARSLDALPTETDMAEQAADQQFVW